MSESTGPSSAAPTIDRVLHDLRTLDQLGPADMARVLPELDHARARLWLSLLMQKEPAVLTMGKARVPDLWTVKEVASQLRFSTGHVYELVRSGQLRGIRHGRTIRIPHEALTEWQAANPAGRLDERRSASGESGADARTSTDGNPRMAQRDRTAVCPRGR
jgi:excisionase family DNA binding protein